MKRLLLFVFVPALVVGLVAAFAPTSDTTYSCGKLPPQLQREYLALGDSLGYGYGATDPATKGYVPLFRDFLESKDWLHRPLLLKNLSIPGATSDSLISDELPAALAELEARNGDWWHFNDVTVVTVDIGGNDLLATLPFCIGGVTPECIYSLNTTIAALSANLDDILGELRAAAGPHTTMIVMTYYNSFVNPYCPYYPDAVPLGNLALEGNAAYGVPVGANDAIRSVADDHNVEVAELFIDGAFLLGPSNVLPDCVHANDSGYAIIAGAFADAYED